MLPADVTSCGIGVCHGRVVCVVLVSDGVKSS